MRCHRIIVIGGVDLSSHWSLGSQHWMGILGHRLEVGTLRRLGQFSSCWGLGKQRLNEFKLYGFVSDYRTT